MTTVYYVCPVCGCPSDQMTILPGRYTPSAQEWHWFPLMREHGHERLRCRCGQQHTWYTLIQRVTRTPHTTTQDTEHGI